MGSLQLLYHILLEAGVTKTVWILISWLLRKPADLDLHCFKKEYIEKVTECTY